MQLQDSRAAQIAALPSTHRVSCPHHRLHHLGHRHHHHHHDHQPGEEGQRKVGSRSRVISVSRQSQDRERHHGLPTPGSCPASRLSVQASASHPHLGGSGSSTGSLLLPHSDSLQTHHAGCTRKNGCRLKAKILKERGKDLQSTPDFLPRESKPSSSSGTHRLENLVWLGLGRRARAARGEWPRSARRRKSCMLFAGWAWCQCGPSPSPAGPWDKKTVVTPRGDGQRVRCRGAQALLQRPAATCWHREVSQRASQLHSLVGPPHGVARNLTRSLFPPPPSTACSVGASRPGFMFIE